MTFTPHLTIFSWYALQDAIEPGIPGLKELESQFRFSEDIKASQQTCKIGGNINFPITDEMPCTNFKQCLLVSIEGERKKEKLTRKEGLYDKRKRQ